ncbi:MAG: hypothetical protein QOK34_1597 [Gaiellaceae bacterium]|jgi:hypothetical protein|nr:hypothetical protein [Gaiellaceae bacterium]
MKIEDAIAAAEEAGLPPRVAPKLEGETLDELRADARALRKLIGHPAPPAPPAPRVPLPDLHGGARDSPADFGTGWFHARPGSLNP